MKLKTIKTEYGIKNPEIAKRILALHQEILKVFKQQIRQMNIETILVCESKIADPEFLNIINVRKKKLFPSIKKIVAHFKQVKLKPSVQAKTSKKTSAQK